MTLIKIKYYKTELGFLDYKESLGMFTSRSKSMLCLNRVLRTLP
jgi:hypothetical protein